MKKLLLHILCPPPIPTGRKLLSFLCAGIVLTHVFAGDERDANGRLIATTRDGVKRDPNGRIIETKSTNGGTETKRDPAGKITSTKSNPSR